MSDLLPDHSKTCTCQNKTNSPLHRILTPLEKDLGGFSVRRLLPASAQKTVGPYVFFDHLGPVTFPPGAGIDVRPHPHIGLATITYLLQGEILHRDNLGFVQPIRPDAINLMTAGRGIVHSERTPPHVRQGEHDLHALQLWIALPVAQESCDPAFHHYPADELPEKELAGGKVRVLIGSAFGLVSPVATFSPTLYVDLQLPAGARMQLPHMAGEYALYSLAGDLQVSGEALPPQQMGVLKGGAAVELLAKSACHLVLIGGEPLGPRTVWWNLVASDKTLIEAAKSAWRDRRFPAVPGETEFIPLPE